VIAITIPISPLPSPSSLVKSFYFKGLALPDLGLSFEALRVMCKSQTLTPHPDTQQQIVELLKLVYCFSCGKKGISNSFITCSLCRRDTFFCTECALCVKLLDHEETCRDVSPIRVCVLLASCIEDKQRLDYLRECIQSAIGQTKTPQIMYIGVYVDNKFREDFNTLKNDYSAWHWLKISEIREKLSQIQIYKDLVSKK